MDELPDNLCVCPKANLRIGAYKKCNAKKIEADRAYQKIEEDIKQELSAMNLKPIEYEHLKLDRLEPHLEEKERIFAEADAERDALFEKIETIAVDTFDEMKEMVQATKKAFDAYLKSKRYFEKRRDKLLDKVFADLGIERTKWV